VYPVPTRLRTRSANVTIPFTAVAWVVPLSVAPPGLAASAMVTWLPAPTTVVSSSSWRATLTAGLSGWPATDGPGCWPKASCVAGRVATETRAVPDFPSVLAVMVTGPPWETPSTTPVVVTDAISGALDCHEKGRPARGRYEASSAIAVKGSVCPTSSPVWPGVTTTWSTGTGRTVTCASPVTPSTVAWIRTGPPRATPLTRPEEETDAIEGLLEDHTTVRPGTATPPEVFGVASSWRVEPSRTSELAGVTSTLATSSTSATPVSDVVHPIE